uniref:Uncharacterized protein n=1 Tax=viral metagenome TaxID=1070528 RepID=A0A6M3JEW9_9ZZZZ
MIVVDTREGQTNTAEFRYHTGNKVIYTHKTNNNMTVRWYKAGKLVETHISEYDWLNGLISDAKINSTVDEIYLS